MNRAQTRKALHKQSRAALELSEKEIVRQSNLLRSGTTSTQELDRARSARDQDRQRVSQLEADLVTAQLGSRSNSLLVPTKTNPSATIGLP